MQITKQDDDVSIDEPTFIATSMLRDSDDIYRVHPLAGNEERSIQNLQWVKNIIGNEAIVR